MRNIFAIALMLIFGVSAAFSQSSEESLRKYVKEGNFEEAEKMIGSAINENPKDEDIYVLCGDVYMELNKYDDAIAKYKKAADLDDDKKIIQKLGTAYSTAGKHEDALKLLNKLVKDNKKDAPSILALANAYLKADSSSKAEVLIYQARELDKSNPAGFLALGDLYFANGVYELSELNYTEALKLDEKLLEARAKLATSLYWLGNRESDETLSSDLYRRSLEEWDKVTTQDPNYAKGWFEQGKIFFLSKQFTQAAFALNKYIQLRPSGSLGRWYLGQSLYEIGKCEDAEIHLQTAAKEIDSVKTRANILLARCYVIQKRYKESSDLYKIMKPQVNFEEDDYLKFSQAALFGGDTTTSISVVLEGADKYPNQLLCEILYMFGATMNKNKRYDDAIKILEKKLSMNICKDSNDYMINYLLGSSYFYSGQTDSAIVPLTKAIELNPKFLWSTIVLADVYANKGDLVKSEETFNAAIAEGAKDTANYKNELINSFSKLANIKMEAKAWKDLEKVGNNWAALIPESVFAYLYSGFGLQGQGPDKYPAACNMFRKALKVDPSNKYAKDALKNLDCK